MAYTIGIVIVVVIIWIVAWTVRSVAARQTLLLAASYLFYSNWGIGFLLILVASSLLNFAWGARLRRRMTFGCLWSGVGLNVLLLGFFKYLPPVLQTIATGGRPLELAQNIIMPVGMSFWTFQGLSYLFDIYREEEMDPSLVEFCLYMAFWPVVFAGPVCRMPDMLPQFRRKPVFSWDDISVGSLRIIQGVFMKMFVATILGGGLVAGQGVAAGFDQMTGGWGGVDIWLLGIGFGFLLFFDFAGYSHIVIGTARLFGIQLPENFNRPFLSTTPSIFWTRWHMSLSSWIRDYVFVPLAAASRNRQWPYAVFVIAMTLFGLWHAARWTFICWGMYHGLVLVVHRLGQQVKRKYPIVIPRRLGAFLAWAVTFPVVSLGWIFFRANSLGEAVSMLGTALNPSAYARLGMPRNFYIIVFIVAAAYFASTAAHALTMSWAVAYRKISNADASGSTVLMKPLAGSGGFRLNAGGLFSFLSDTLWWWFAPTVALITALIGIAIYQQNAVVSVTPFIYTLF
jgi:D-alanyl-lipoteichoic acid acyltransferase DltB (MBOAT superfamily)